MKRFVGLALVFAVCCSLVSGFAGVTGNEPYPEFKVRNGVQFNMKKEEVIAVESRNAKRNKMTLFFRSSPLVLSENASSTYYIPEIYYDGLKGTLYYGFSDDGYLKVIQYQFKKEDVDPTLENAEDFSAIWESIIASMQENYGAPTHTEEERDYWAIEDDRNPEFYVIASAPISPDLSRYNLTYLLHDYRAEETDTLDAEDAFLETESD